MEADPVELIQALGAVILFAHSDSSVKLNEAARGKIMIFGSVPPKDNPSYLFVNFGVME